jgi:aminoglycoside phosphotransferase (APT) family kinase protein
MAEWDAEVRITAEEAAEVVAAHYPQFRDSRIVEFAEGWDNVAFLLDDIFVFRFPRRAISVELLRRETTLLPQISESLPLPISVPRFHGSWRENGWLFAGYRMLEGEQASQRDISDDARSRMAIPLAEFLQALHAIDSTPLIATGLSRDLFGRFDAEKRTPKTLQRVESIRGSGYKVPPSLVEWFRLHPPRLDERLTLVHGDLYARHVLLGQADETCGIIDWGDMHLGTPAIDLAVIHTMLPHEAHQSFLQAYGHVAEPIWDAARWRGIYSALLCLEYGIQADAEDMRQCGVAALALIERGLTTA